MTNLNTLQTDLGKELARSFRAEALKQIRDHAKLAENLLTDRALDLRKRNHFLAADTYNRDSFLFDAIARSLSQVIEALEEEPTA